jgi:uncharacterized protein YbcI
MNEPAIRAHPTPAAEISRELVHLVRKITGRGPSTARTTIGRDHVLVMLQGTLNQGELTLVEQGYESTVQSLRQAYQQVMREEASEAVARIVGRRVIGFMSTNHFDPDMAAEIFLLEPAENGAAAPHEDEVAAEGLSG